MNYEGEKREDLIDKSKMTSSDFLINKKIDTNQERKRARERKEKQMEE